MNEVDASSFTSDTSTPCKFNITPDNTEIEPEKLIKEAPQNNTSIHSHSKQKYRDTFGDAHLQHHDFDNGHAFT